MVGHRTPLHEESLIDDQRSLDLVLGLSMLGEADFQHELPTLDAVHQHVVAFVPSAESIVHIVV